MCRKNQLYGWAVIALGIGIFIGCKMGGGFVTGCIGFGILAFGVSLLQKK
ncbi:MAG: hypothetical protein IJO56_00650 [Oscillospiraceae bacterium]|nr:hypothetical protein [Oscillospiraceae bacterium]MBQ9837992.1 hypothetical protein [Oscillospiraceae bacterium]